MEKYKSKFKEANENFDEKFKSWLEGCKDIIDRTWSKLGYDPSFKPVLEYTKGGRYMRVITRSGVSQGGSAYAFIDVSNGDVLKPASWKAPAKHARGNIFDDNNGLKFMSLYGPAYLNSRG